MSDQDFFFEDEEAETTDGKSPKPGAKPTPAKSGSKPAPRPASKSGSAAAKAPQAPPSFFDQTVTVAIASLLAVIALLLGVVIGYFVFSGSGQTVVTAPGSITAPGATGTGTPAPLTQDQLNSGQLPAGHPKVGGSTVATPTGK